MATSRSARTTHSTGICAPSPQPTRCPVTSARRQRSPACTPLCTSTSQLGSMT
jgi:hypothetical protein